jgi:hypothetical protein
VLYDSAPSLHFAVGFPGTGGVGAERVDAEWLGAGDVRGVASGDVRGVAAGGALVGASPFATPP